MARTEIVLGARCAAIWDVFPDGPPPTGERPCAATVAGPAAARRGVENAAAVSDNGAARLYTALVAPTILSLNFQVEGPASKAARTPRTPGVQDIHQVRSRSPRSGDERACAPASTRRLDMTKDVERAIRRLCAEGADDMRCAMKVTAHPASR
jgi:hypothetical protein